MASFKSSSKNILNCSVNDNSNSWIYRYEHLADPRTQDWLLVSSLNPVLMWVAAYLIMAVYISKFFKRFKPFKLHGLLIIYNLSMALLNLHIFKELLINASHLKYSYWCQPCRVIYSEHEIKLASAVWWFYFSKLLEFSDTAFFILRQKWKQLTPLHVYHHSTMFPLWWIAIKWVPTGSTFFPALINSFVHVIMYTYYGLSACGPAVQKYLWWKKYLTGLQLLQFTLGLLWAVQALVNRCDFPEWINCATIVYMISFLILFGRFYKREYRRSKESKKLKGN
ncbi:elongation of very long chain fatty acids protein 4-like [Musca domestica]|uniref:Elongation of very long chain fatty acids protein n=1 Tax=Musca domestica TaxID=7370 RepID=A0A1I8N5Z8_MUSDO|nr:elongation of very long chain fatty acids protein 4-like [Musca domestica]